MFKMAEAAQEVNTDIQTLQSSGIGEDVIFGFEDCKLTKVQSEEVMQLLETLKEKSKAELPGLKSLGEYYEER